MASLQLRERFRPGGYRFTVREGGRSYVLATDDGIELEKSTLGDSVGSRLGIVWAPAPGAFAPGHTVEFQLETPREVARRLAEALQVHLDPDGNFLRVELEGPRPRDITDIVNGIAD